MRLRLALPAVALLFALVTLPGAVAAEEVPLSQISASASTPLPEKEVGRFIQVALVLAGIDPGRLDGQLGPKTMQAIAVFQLRFSAGRDFGELARRAALVSILMRDGAADRTTADAKPFESLLIASDPEDSEVAPASR